jgi:hypothetical protein
MRSHRHRHTMKRAAGLNGLGAGWAGRYQIGSYLANAVQSADWRPPEAPGVYIVSEHEWRDVPDSTCGLLYVAKAAYVRYRLANFCVKCVGSQPTVATRRLTGIAVAKRSGIGIVSHARPNPLAFTSDGVVILLVWIARR